MELRHIILTLLALALPVACSNLPQAEVNDKKDHNTEKSAEGVEKTKDLVGEPSDADPALDGLGLAQDCKHARDAAGKSCFTCAPRELPITQCVASDEGFDPAVACSHDFDKMTCKVKVDVEFVFDFEKHSDVERVYEKIPLFALGAKVFLANRLNDEPALKKLIYAALTSIDKCKRPMFTGGDLKPCVDDLMTSVKVFKPDLEVAVLDKTKTALLGVLTSIQVKIASGKLMDNDVVDLVQALLKQLPIEVPAAIADLDMAAILATVSDINSDNKDLQGALGKQSLQDLLDQAQAGSKAKAK